MLTPIVANRDVWVGLHYITAILKSKSAGTTAPLVC